MRTKTAVTVVVVGVFDRATKTWEDDEVWIASRSLI